MRKFDSDQGQRQLRVSAQIRSALAEILQRGHFREESLIKSAHKITVTEVRISPDLKHATAFVMPLGGKDIDVLIPALNQEAYHIQSEIGHHLRLRHTPKMRFVSDDSFDQVEKIDRLLNSDRVKSDLSTDTHEA